jgi:excisionase family DNA binding protein
VKDPIPVLKLEDLARDPAAVDNLPAEEVWGLLGQLEELRARLWRRNTTVNGQPERPTHGDRLLTIEEAAAKLGCSKDSIYRSAATLPFTVREGRRLRFSEQGIESYIRQRTGR